MIYIHFYCQGYENSKGLASIQNFTIPWAIKNKQMVNVWTFDKEIELNWGGSGFSLQKW
jgi:hypothetical protein